ncbi:MAG: macrolide ABC transporter ATP-binding protein [Planctomycetes bacterium SCN 63-9]|nr:MAG: macrolide ABC transporter ATP-binding protein [Planctomycetes bacterium SCN 63-9]
MDENQTSAEIPTGPAILADGVEKRYGTGSAPVVALRGISLKVERGERVALLGKSGSGKSTLLNLLGGLDRPTEGRLMVDGRDLSKLSADGLADFRLGSVGMIFQAYNLIPSRTALENVELPMILSGQSREIRREQAREALESVGLGKRLDHHPAELVNRPAILLADEPTGNLDSPTARSIMELLAEHLGRHETTLVMVTHDEELAEAHSDRIVRLKDGQVIE